jgi:hypothetical protein
MSKNYYITRVAEKHIPIQEEVLVGTRHFTAGQKVFTFVLQISEFLRQCDPNHMMYTEDSTEYMTMEHFCMVVLAECDKVVYEKGKP